MGFDLGVSGVERFVVFSFDSGFDVYISMIVLNYWNFLFLYLEIIFIVFRGGCGIGG